MLKTTELGREPRASDFKDNDKNIQKKKLYTVPFSEIVPTANMEHGMIGCLAYKKTKKMAYRRVLNFLATRARRYQLEEDDNLYNPPIVLNCKSINEKKVLAEIVKMDYDTSYGHEKKLYKKYTKKIIDGDKIHPSTISEIEHSNLGMGAPDHRGHNGGWKYLRESVYHFAGNPEDWTAPKGHRKIIKKSWKKDNLEIFDKPPKHIR